MSVKKAQREINSAEFAHWVAYYRIDPFGDERADLRAGIIASTVANVHATKKSQQLKPADFMPDFEPPKRQSTKEMIDVMRKFTKAMGGKIIKPGKK